MSEPLDLNLDPLVHAPVRLGILSILVNVVDADFTTLKELTGATDGNLSTHLAKLERGGLVAVRKTFQGRKPLTTCQITPAGRTALEAHLETLARRIKQTTPDNGRKKP